MYLQGWGELPGLGWADGKVSSWASSDPGLHWEHIYNFVRLG